MSLNHPLAANLRKQENYAETSIRVHDPGGAVLCRPGLCRWRHRAVSLIPIGAGIAMGLAAGLCGMGQGRAVARPQKQSPATPEPAPAIMLFLVLGLAFIESLTLFTMVIVFVKM